MDVGGQKQNIVSRPAKTTNKTNKDYASEHSLFSFLNFRFYFLNLVT